MRFPVKKNAGCPKAPRDFPPRKDGILYPRRVVLRPHRVCADGRTDGRMYGRTDVRTDSHLTITSQPKFLGLIGYQISLAMELRWRALPAGSAINHCSHRSQCITRGPCCKYPGMRSNITDFKRRNRVLSSP